MGYTQSIPVEFMLHCMRTRKITHLRDFLLVRFVSRKSGSYFSKERLRAFFSPIRVERLLEEGWIVQIGPDWYRMKSVYKICADLDLKIKRKVSIRLDDVKVMSQRFKAYCLAQAEQYVGYRRKMQERAAKWHGEGAKNTKAQNSDHLAVRYMQKVTGLSVSTISRLRKKYNHVYASYRKVYCPDFDKLNYQSKEQVSWWVESSERESELNIFYDKFKKRYRRVLNTSVYECKVSIGDFYSISNTTIYTLYKKYTKAA